MARINPLPTDYLPGLLRVIDLQNPVDGPSIGRDVSDTNRVRLDGNGIHFELTKIAGCLIASGTSDIVEIFS